MTRKFNSLDDVAAAFGKPVGTENDAKFEQGQVVIDAAAEGFKVQDICDHVADVYTISPRTVYRYYAVKRTFSTHDSSKPFGLYEVACEGIDYRHGSEDEIAEAQGRAEAFLLTALSEAWNTRQLREAMQGKRPTPTRREIRIPIDDEISGYLYEFFQYEDDSVGQIEAAMSFTRRAMDALPEDIRARVEAKAENREDSDV